MFLDDLGWLATASNLNQRVSKLQKCTATSIEWVSWGWPQCDTATMEVALFAPRQGHKKHLWPKLIAMITVGDGCTQFNNEATHWLRVWMDAHLMFKEHHD